MSEKVSVIIPVHKVEKYLNRCVESVVNQSYRNLEIILVDDGSPDNCPQICDEWAAKDARIKVIHKENAGAGQARNTGMEIATGRYLMFVDSDDYLSAPAVMSLCSRMKDDNSDMAVGKHIDIYEDGRVNDVFCRWMKNEVLLKNDILRQMGSDQRVVVMSCMKMYRREVFRDVRFPSLTCGEDCWIFPDVMERCEKISIVEDLVYYYFQRSDSVLHQKKESQQLDDIRANLKLSHYLFTHGYFEGARKWYKNAIDKGVSLKHKKKARKIFDVFYVGTERRKLFREADIKLRMKYICLYVPMLYYMIRVIKCIERRMHR